MIALAAYFCFFCISMALGALESMQFQKTHPIVRAKVLSVFTHAYSDYDSTTHTSTERTEVCADTIQFSANGHQIKVQVKSRLYCDVQTGDQPKVAYDPKDPSNWQFVTSGDPFWGNVLVMLLALGMGGFCLSLVTLFLFHFLEGMRWLPRAFSRFSPFSQGCVIAVIFWVIGAVCIVTLLVIKYVNLNP
jgi:hypothetical protein